MKAGGIDVSRIESMLAQMKKAAQKPEIDKTNPVNGLAIDNTKQASKVNFSDALKNSLNEVNQVQKDAKTLSHNFAMGDDSVALSDVMIAGQKANISFQATVQVRNKLVSAYQEMMNMQV